MAELQRARIVVPSGRDRGNWTRDVPFAGSVRIRDEFENIVADCRTIDGLKPKADRQRDAMDRADLIVLAVNSHDELVTALRDTADALRLIRDNGPGLIAQHGDALAAGLAVLAKVDGERERT